MHYSSRDFDDELSRRTLDNFIKMWDPGKVYFLQADIDRFNNEYGNKLDDLLEASNCKFVDDILNTYSQRFKERQLVIAKFIDLKHDFNVDEYLEIERKTMPWAKTIEEVNERWRKRMKFQYMQLKEGITEHDKITSKLRKRYELATKRQNELTSDDVYAMLLNSFAQGLDPHSDYMSAEELEDFRINTKLSLEGIGAVLRSEDGFTTIQNLVPGGAAIKTGKLKVDDKIIAVAQATGEPVDVIDMDVRDVVKLIRGPRGTEVRLTIVRDELGKSVQFVVPVQRDTIQLVDKTAKSKVYDLKTKDGSTLKVGIITLPSFYMDFEGRQNRAANFRSSSADMLKEINALKAKKIDAMIVDLRANGGGALDESIKIAGFFFDQGPVVQTKSMDGSIDTSDDKDPKVQYDGPLAILIDRQSASASEILAGAIQDYGRGLIVGDSHTFGKGTVQTLQDIPGRLGAIKVTMSKFYRPSGGTTQLKGVEADIVFPDLMDEYEMGEKYYDYALQWDQIKSSECKKQDLVTPHIAALKTASQGRITTDESFKKIAEDIKKYRDSVNERNRVSLKEDKEKAKKEAAEKNDKSKKKNGDEEETMTLVEDAHLQEALRVTGDYIQLLRNKPMTLVSIPALDEQRAKAKPKIASQPGGKNGKQVKSAKEQATSEGAKEGAIAVKESGESVPSKPKGVVTNDGRLPAKP